MEIFYRCMEKDEGRGKTGIFHFARIYNIVFAKGNSGAFAP